MDVGADSLHIIVAYLLHLGNIAITHKFTVFIVVPWGKWHNFVCQPHQILGLTGEEEMSGGAVSVVKRPDADGIPGGDEAAGGGVVEDEGELRVQHFEHLHSVLPPERE